MLVEWTTGSTSECSFPSSLLKRLLGIHQVPAQMPPSPGSLPGSQGARSYSPLSSRLLASLWYPGLVFRPQAMVADIPRLQFWPCLCDSGPVPPPLQALSPLFSGNSDGTSIVGCERSTRDVAWGGFSAVMAQSGHAASGTCFC